MAKKKNNKGTNEIVKVDSQVTVQDALLQKKVEILEATQNQHTKKTYQNALNVFSQFCIDNQFEIDIFTQSIDEKTLTDFIAYLQGKYKYKTIETYVYALNTLQAEKGLKKPVTEIVKKFLLRVKKFQNEMPKQAKAITYSDLCNVVSKIDTSTNKGKRDKAILLVGFFGCLRRSEIANLEILDTKQSKGFLTVDGQDGFYITLKQHKTDKDGTPAVKYVSAQRNPLICPLLALQDWLKACNVCTGKLFITVRKGDHVDCDAPLTDKTIYRIIKGRFGDDYSGHSLRVGFAVSARDLGADMESIQKQGAWKSATMPTRYTQQSDLKKNNATSVF